MKVLRRIPVLLSGLCAAMPAVAQAPAAAVNLAYEEETLP